MAEVAGVLDLTFMDITEEADLERVLTEKFSAPQAADSPTRTTRRKREEYRAIRLANNSIESLDILGGPIAKYLDCTKIQWLDLSFNAVRRVSDGFLEAFPNVTTLYFHANRISRLSEIKKISNFSQLRSLSLYGNPVEEHKHYHNYVLYTCAVLHHFDMSPVTKHERQQMEVWSRTFRKKLNPEEE